MCERVPLLWESGWQVDRDPTAPPDACRGLLLTHAHDDHAGHVRPQRWRQCPSIQVWSSQITRDILWAAQPALREYGDRWHVFPWEQVVRLDDRWELWATPAYHCDGSALLALRHRADQQVWVITGDWRGGGPPRALPWTPTTIYYDATLAHVRQVLPSMQDTWRWWRERVPRPAYVHAGVLGWEPLMRHWLSQEPSMKLWLDPRLPAARQAVLRLLLPSTCWTDNEATATWRLSHRRWADHWELGIAGLVLSATRYLCRPHARWRPSHLERDGRTWWYVPFVTHSTEPEWALWWQRWPHAKRRSCYVPLDQLRCQEGVE